MPSKKLVSFKATASSRAESHVPGNAVIIKDAKPTWINSLVKKDNPKINKIKKKEEKIAVPVNEEGEKPILIKLPTDRFTLDWWKCYLDS